MGPSCACTTGRPRGSPAAPGLTHGAGEHSGRDEGVGRRFAEAGIAVTAYDHRGHGASSGRRGDVERWTDLTADAGRMVDGTREAAADAPVALMGHSMGGLVALDAVLSGAASPDLLVLPAPAIGDGLPRWHHLVAPLTARVRPTLALANGGGATRSPRPGGGRGRRFGPAPSRVRHGAGWGPWPSRRRTGSRPG